MRLKQNCNFKIKYTYILKKKKNENVHQCHKMLKTKNYYITMRIAGDH